MRGEPAHRVERHRIAGDGLVLPAPRVRPRDRQFDLRVPRGDTQFLREAVNRGRRHSGDFGRPFGRVVCDPIDQELMHRLHRAPVGQDELAVQRRIGAFGVRRHGSIRDTVPPQRIAIVFRGPVRVGRELGAAHEEAEIVGAFVEVDELPGVGEAREKCAIEKTERHDLVDERQQQRAVGAGTDRHPLVGDGRIAGADRIDRDEAAAVALELGDRDLQRIRMVILGRADHHEELRAVEVGAAELPERAADRIDHPGRHVDRAEAAVRRVVGCAELPREKARQRLHLVAAGEHRELLGVGGADASEALFQHPIRVIPADLDEFARAAFRAGLPPQRFREARRGILLHDSGAALGADHPLVDRMIRVPLDVADLAVAHMHADAAAAGAHVAGRVLGFRRGARQRRGQGVVERWRGHRLARPNPSLIADRAR